MVKYSRINQREVQRLRTLLSSSWGPLHCCSPSILQMPSDFSHLSEVTCSPLSTFRHQLPDCQRCFLSFLFRYVLDLDLHRQPVSWWSSSSSVFFWTVWMWVSPTSIWSRCTTFSSCLWTDRIRHLSYIRSDHIKRRPCILIESDQ